MARAFGLGDRCPPEGRLADPRLTPEHECRGQGVLGNEEPRQSLLLSLPADDPVRLDSHRGPMMPRRAR